ncbi:hypothetical protein HY495_03085 [Candidatus Woesearchaeota archaeon]|nr:hypothetical protein [Candidatus Woesearchaeota archaeon]
MELKEGGKLSIDLSKATEEEQRSLKEKILDLSVQKQEEVFLIDDSSQTTQKIKQNLPDDNDESLLKFYKDKLKPEWYKALEASIILRNAFKKGHDITELKRDISRRYPLFGNNLCNLTTERYFDDHFKKLYESMIDEEDFDILIYQRKVEKIITSLPYTVFVTRHKTYDQLSGEVAFKLEKLKRYGTGRLLLHGIGRENVSTTLNLLGEYKTERTITIQEEINFKETIITATLIF